MEGALGSCVKPGPAWECKIMHNERSSRRRLIKRLEPVAITVCHISKVFWMEYAPSLKKIMYVFVNTLCRLHDRMRTRTDD